MVLNTDPIRIQTKIYYHKICNYKWNIPDPLTYWIRIRNAAFKSFRIWILQYLLNHHLDCFFLHFFAYRLPQSPASQGDHAWDESLSGDVISQKCDPVVRSPCNWFRTDVPLCSGLHNITPTYLSSSIALILHPLIKYSWLGCSCLYAWLCRGGYFLLPSRE